MEIIENLHGYVEENGHLTKVYWIIFSNDENILS